MTRTKSKTVAPLPAGLPNPGRKPPLTRGGALRLYEGFVAPCFSTAAERAEALGISDIAIRKWDRGQLKYVRRSSAERVFVLALTCRRLSSRFSRPADVGAYLLHDVFEADRRVRPLDLVIETRDPAAAVELFDATRAATAAVVKKRLPPEAFADEAWANVLVAQSEDERELEKELLAMDETNDIPAVL